MTDAGDRPLRVLIIVNRLFEWSQGFITRELVELVRQGIDVRIGARRVTPRGDLDSETSALRGRVVPLPETPFTPACLFAHARFALSHPARYERAVRSGFGLGHRRPMRALRSLVCFFRAAAVARDVASLDPDLIHAHFLTAPGETAVHLSRLVGVPFGATAHAMDLYVDTSGNRGKLARAAYLATCTEANARHLAAEDLIDPERVHVIYHGIDVDAAAAARVHDPAGEVAFLACGRFVEKKGFEHLIDACHILDERGVSFSCRIVGRGELEDAYARRIEDAGIGHRVSLAGYVPPNRMHEVYESADVLVVPSIIAGDGDRDGLPNVCLEAMTHGLAIIGSRVGGIPEGVFDGVNGILVPPGDVDALAGAMETLVDRGLTRMKAASRDLALEKFDVRPNVARLAAVMRGHAAKPRRNAPRVNRHAG